MSESSGRTKSALKKLLATFRRQSPTNLNDNFGSVTTITAAAAVIDDETAAMRKCRLENPRSLEHLRSLCNVISKNNIVTEQNKTLIVETLRSTAEILIWGDQNDSTVFDFFLEKNMLSFFLTIMKQRCGSYVCVQLLQTLNILFENIRNETSLYYLLSNNHVNSIIVHKFDFTDEEVMAYYISFLKTLSFKLNPYTIHFFFSTNDFPLYTEAIKFFSHSEKMVRIAVRTLTLNVFRVDEKSMLKFITDRTAVPFFSKLIWIIRDHVNNIDKCLKTTSSSLDEDEQKMLKLDDLFAEHLDHLHYLSDILMLKIDSLNKILIDHLMQRLLIPLVESYEDDPNASMLKLFTLEFATNSVNLCLAPDSTLLASESLGSCTQSQQLQSQEQNNLVTSSIASTASPASSLPTNLNSIVTSHANHEDTSNVGSPHNLTNSRSSVDDKEKPAEKEKDEKKKMLMSPQHVSLIEQLKDKAEVNLREIFRNSDHRNMIELFKTEYQDVRRRRLDIDYLYMDSRLLLDYTLSKQVFDLTRSITTDFKFQNLHHKSNSTPIKSQSSSPTHQIIPYSNSSANKRNANIANNTNNKTVANNFSNSQKLKKSSKLSKCQIPLDEHERKKHCIRVYLLWRQLLHNIRREQDKEEIALDEAVFNVRLAFCASTLQSLMHQYVKANARAKQKHKWRDNQTGDITNTVPSPIPHSETQHALDEKQQPQCNIESINFQEADQQSKLKQTKEREKDNREKHQTLVILQMQEQNLVNFQQENNLINNIPNNINSASNDFTRLQMQDTDVGLAVQNVVVGTVSSTASENDCNSPAESKSMTDGSDAQLLQLQSCTRHIQHDHSEQNLTQDQSSEQQEQNRESHCMKDPKALR